MPTWLSQTNYNYIKTPNTLFRVLQKEGVERSSNVGKMDIRGYECFRKKSFTESPDFAIARNEKSDDLIGIVEIKSANNVIEDFLKAKGTMLAAMITQSTKFGFAAAMEGNCASLVRFSRSDENEPSFRHKFYL